MRQRLLLSGQHLWVWTTANGASIPGLDRSLRPLTDRTKPDTNDGRVKTNEREIAKLLGLKMVNDPVNKLQIKLLEGTDRFINFAFSKKFNEHLSLPWPGRRIRE